MGRGSPICDRVRKKIVEYFKNNVLQRQIAKALQISLSTVHNIIKRFRETGEKSVRKGQGRRPLLDARGLRALRRHCITHRHDSVIDIIKWAQEYFQKPLSVNTICRAICRCQLKLYHAKRKPYVNMAPEAPSCPVGQVSFKMDCWKVFYGQMSPNLTFLLEITDTVSSGLKRRETFQRVISIQFKSQHIWWYGVHKCIQYWQLACFGRHYECWNMYKGFRATCAPLQTMCISAVWCKTTYCSYYNSMAS